VQVEAELAGFSPDRDTFLTVGVFDGVHLGHQRLIAELLDQARRSDRLASVVADARGVREVVESSNVEVYAVQFDTTREAPPMTTGLDPSLAAALAFETSARFAEATDLLAALGAESGGAFLRASPERLTDDVARIGAELGGQYVLAYRPARPGGDPASRRIRVEVNRPSVTVRSRTACRAKVGA